MSKNILTVNDVIDKCTQCKHHRVYPFLDYRAGKHIELIGVFCLKAEYTKEWGYETRDGDEIFHRLVAEALRDPSQKADIPDWCPRLCRA